VPAADDIRVELRALGDVTDWDAEVGNALDRDHYFLPR
jgi:hypothetical protein